MKVVLAGLLSLFSLHAAAAEQFAKVGANQLAFECRGEGSKTVLLIAGMGLDAHTTYKNTFRNFSAPGYQVCLYDRAGVGKSTPQTAARPLRALADELDGLVKARGWHDVVLVAHSFGGMIINWERDKNSHEDFAEAAQAMNSGGRTLDMPVTVLSRGLPETKVRQAKMRYEDVDAFNTTWDAAQFELTKVSGDMRHVRMRYTNHMFDEQDPWLVLDEIGLLIKRVEAKPRS